MSQIVAGKKSRKKQSTFEKLWARAAKLRAQNARFTADLDAVVARMENTILPREVELARQQIPLLQKLLTLGQRKSMTNWERETLDDWIRELVEITQVHGLFNEELMDDVARYDAFRIGVTLEDDSIPPHKQFVEIIRQAEEERAEAVKREQEERQQNSEKLKEMLISEAEHEINRKLDAMLGPEPAKQEKHSLTEDLWADELEVEQERQVEAYHIRRAALYEQMMADRLAEIDAVFSEDFTTDEDDEFNFDDFDFADFDADPDFGSHSRSPDSAPAAGKKAALSNETFQRLFRATAGKLHPDREPDSEVRKEKQRLMANLLKARKKGDVMTILEMYETYVGEHEGFSKADQKSLIDSLKQMIEELEDQKEEIAFQSPLHATAYHAFYHQSRKKIDAAFVERLNDMKAQQKIIAQLIRTITSLKSLKPQLAARYDSISCSEPTFEDFMNFVEKGRPF